MLLFPVLFCRAPKPVAVLLLPLALVKRASVPKAVVPAPDVAVERIHAGSSVRLAGSLFKERLRTIGRVVAGVVVLSSTTKQLNGLCAAIGEGMPLKGACTVAGIGVTTSKEWRERYPDLEEGIADARAWTVKSSSSD